MDKSSRTYLREYHRQLCARIKAEVFAHYGDRCACCGTTEDLSIDHIAGGGQDHRRELWSHPYASHHFYLWLRRNDFPDGYDLLCLPCNRSKGQGERCRIAHDRPGYQWCSHPQHVGEEPLPLEEFHRTSMTKNGRRSRCKECRKRDRE